MKDFNEDLKLVHKAKDDRLVEMESMDIIKKVTAL